MVATREYGSGCVPPVPTPGAERDAIEGATTSGRDCEGNAGPAGSDEEIAFGVERRASESCRIETVYTGTLAAVNLLREIALEFGALVNQDVNRTRTVLGFHTVLTLEETGNDALN